MWLKPFHILYLCSFSDSNGTAQIHSKAKSCCAYFSSTFSDYQTWLCIFIVMVWGLKLTLISTFHPSNLKGLCSRAQMFSHSHFLGVKTKIEGDIEAAESPWEDITLCPKEHIYLQGCIKYGINSSTHTCFSASQLQSKLCLFNKLKVNLGKIHTEGFDFGRKALHLHRVPP